MTVLAEITFNGAVLLGKCVACDAFDASRPLRVVTHAHADHMVGLRKSLKLCENVLMTEATRELIEVLKGEHFISSGRVKALDYGEPFEYGEERLILLPADHILGAAQVLVEAADGSRVVYTGDFRIDETPTVEADVLVMEATYGSPWCRRPFNHEIKYTLVSLVEEHLCLGPVYVFGYYGKLQEVMHLLYNLGVKVSFLMPERIFNISKVYERHGIKLGRIICLESDEGKEILKSKGSYVAFYHMNSRSRVNGGFRIYVSGWMFSSPCRKLSENEYLVALSDHSDFDGLLEYVRLSRPRRVILDNYRVSRAEVLAREIRRRLGIPAVAMPK
ncbi:hypothetical protein H5T51_09010 [Candidatus Bathyarchaeota archaeon]|nr:hypothetical protein [Candidatus Bathyarchaeota archaeon]